MSTTIIAVFIQLAIVILPAIGINVGTAELTNAVQTIGVVTTGLWIWYQRVQRGDVKLFGGRKAKFSDF